MKARNHDFAIEEVNSDNFSHFLNLIDELAEFEKLMPPDSAAKERLKHDCLGKSPKYRAFLGKAGSEYASYVIYYFTYSSFLALQTFYLEDIFVLQEFRKSGMGRKMFSRCVEIASEKECGRMEWSVLKWNENAIKFYERIGARQLDEWATYRMDKSQIRKYADSLGK